MPVYHFTVHAYGSWHPDHPEGYTRRGTRTLAPDADLGMHYRMVQQGPTVFFDHVIQRTLIESLLDCCRRREWRLHGVATDDSHFHWVLSWRGDLTASEVLNKSKNVLGTLLGKARGSPEVRWFVRGGTCRRVLDLKHLAHLLESYLPSHPGLCWFEHCGYCDGKSLRPS